MRPNPSVAYTRSQVTQARVCVQAWFPHTFSSADQTTASSGPKKYGCHRFELKNHTRIVLMNLRVRLAPRGTERRPLRGGHRRGLSSCCWISYRLWLMHVGFRNYQRGRMLQTVPAMRLWYRAAAFRPLCGASIVRRIATCAVDYVPTRKCTHLTPKSTSDR